MKLPPISHTFHEKYDICPKQAWHAYIAKDLPQEVKSPAQENGIYVHQKFERRINEQAPLPPDMQRWEKFCNLPGFRMTAELKLGARADGTPCGFFDADVYMRGVIDLLLTQGTGVVVIWDWKTGKPRENPTELRLHALLLKIAQPKITRVSGSFVWLQDGKIGAVHDLSQFEQTWTRARDTQAEIAHRFNLGADAFPTRENSLCGWCCVVSCQFNPKRKPAA